MSMLNQRERVMMHSDGCTGPRNTDFITVYHVSFSCDETTKYYYPRVPKSAMAGEDKSTPRICFADSIEGCITAMPKSQRNLDIGARMMVFPFLVSQNDPAFISTQMLEKERLVPDAIYTGECWYTKPVELKGSVYEIVDFAWAHYFFPVEDDRPLIYDRLKRYWGVPQKYIEPLDNYKIFDVVNNVLNSHPEYWDYDQFLGDSIAEEIGIPGSLLFDYLFVDEVSPDGVAS